MPYCSVMALDFEVQYDRNRHRSMMTEICSVMGVAIKVNSSGSGIERLSLEG